MLLPSALPCDHHRRNSHAAAGMVSPPASPPKLSAPATFRIASSCLNLQSLIANTTTSAESQTQQQQHHSHDQQQQQQSYFGDALLPQPLPTPPMAHAPSPMKLRLRTRNLTTTTTTTRDEPRGIVKRTTPLPARHHKRTLSSSSSSSSSSEREQTPEPPTTPKRSRIAPPRMPLGLARADFHNLSPAAQQQQQPQDNGADEWTTEDDRVLVELVLEKLKLSKADWHDCARALGRDRHALSRRWRSLVLNDDVGLKRRKMPSTWR